MKTNFDGVKKGSGRELLEQEWNRQMSIHRFLTYFVIIGLIVVILSPFIIDYFTK